MASNRIDATRGAIVPQILRYSYPLILSTLVQSLFSAVDVAVLGNMADSNAVAYVGATGAVTSLLVNAFVGFSSGTKILLARFIGARDQERIRHTADTAVLLSEGLSYQKISEQVNVSTATIGRVSRCLNYGNGGYRQAIGKLKAKE